MDDTIKEVKESWTFTFSIGKKYQSTITCDVLQMTVCHVILGKPWQYDNKAMYDGFKNTYEVQWGEKTIAFLLVQWIQHSCLLSYSCISTLFFPSNWTRPILGNKFQVNMVATFVQQTQLNYECCV